MMAGRQVRRSRDGQCRAGHPDIKLQGVRVQLAEANLKLSERKLIERAKGLLMKSRGLDEEAAFAFMRKSAMDRKLKLAELAQRVVDAAELISGA